jgi:predicted nucleotidyltransferase
LSIKYYEVSADEVVKKLSKILRDMPKVKIALLFGSATRRRFVRDIDVGVYLNSQDELKDIIKITNLLEDALKVPVDVVPLLKVNPKLRLNALLNGIKLVVKDRKLYALLVSQALSETMDIKIKSNLIR